MTVEVFGESFLANGHKIAQNTPKGFCVCRKYLVYFCHMQCQTFLTFECFGTSTASKQNWWVLQLLVTGLFAPISNLSGIKDLFFIRMQILSVCQLCIKTIALWLTLAKIFWMSSWKHIYWELVSLDLLFTSVLIYV